MSDQSSQRQDTRRTHRKSRNGCVTCKQRRVKCDEGRPRCSKCVFGDRPCSYQNQKPETPTSPTPTPRVSETPQPRAEAGTFTAMDLAFLHHAECNLAEFMALQCDMKPIITLAVDNALTTPYLLDQLLALSALHRAVSDPAMASVYHQQATELQTRALSAFNETKADISESNHLTSFVFATLLGVHVLRNTLANNHHSLVAFISAFVAYIRLHRGVRAVTNQYWGLILQSELKPLLYIVDWADRADQLEPGTDTARMREFLQSTPGISSLSLDACLDALKQVQWVLDTIRLEPTRFDLAVHATMAWPLLVPDDYVDALYQHRPEALAVLSYYAAIVHRYREFWVFLGGAGSTLVELIARHIGPFWCEVMAWPQSEVFEGE
ncbi:uncharacterized protein NECHADRAFT_91510 [Fusarium vanettenii 77-13-4]|uniref:Zn(2)-C6 fungal-type domain-containing protein n=1 Tax=Fusarium vanettenii (strain ATCC MYA-4622 / CBS 123669 / FGSC 9596 / NRRL 45880 / 77-13-4) TaxID=660122 RepID=C7ZCP6_FUSV7|nr:uncharacterized protein NECHADRAFT_91510 [Fusarium vanettenii 77-13-4]EEU38405.1 hypothetical protein NECHADRAFT_91510 [Fusarium vanettenii 77-13-4]